MKVPQGQIPQQKFHCTGSTILSGVELSNVTSLWSNMPLLTKKKTEINKIRKSKIFEQQWTGDVVDCPQNLALFR